MRGVSCTERPQPASLTTLGPLTKGHTVARPRAQTTEEPNTDEETPEPIEGDDQDAEEQEAEEQTPDEAATEEGSADLPERLEEAFHSHAGKLRAIYGTALEHFLCPLCSGYGIVDQGVTAMDVFAWDESTEECPVCRGMGQIRRHTHAEGHLLGTCTACGGQGWKMRQAPQAPVYQASPPPQPVAAGNGGSVYTAAQAQMGMLNPDGSFTPFGSPGSQ